MANTLTFASQTLTDANIFGGISFLADLNTGEEFSIGNTASASVKFTTDIQLPLYTKDAVNGTFTWTQDSVSRGRFYITEVTKVADRYTVTAYDAMILLDTNISALSIPFPTTVSVAASAIATYIGCTVSGTVNNGSLTITALDSALTVRQLLGYIAETSGCSVKIDGADHLCFMYYASSGITITASEYKTLDVADYVCAAIDKVIIFGSTGAIQAQAGSGSNALYIQGNPILFNATDAHAQTILSKVSGFAYAPLTCELFSESGLEIGKTATFGTTTTLVMHIESSEDGAVASSVGSDSRAAYNKSLAAMISEAMASAVGEAVEIMTDELGNIYQLSILTSYTSTSVVHTAQLLQNGVDIAPDVANDFEWSAKLTTGFEYIGTGRSITIPQDSLNYAHAVTVMWTRRQNAYLLNNAGNNLVTNNGSKLVGRTEY